MGTELEQRLTDLETQMSALMSFDSIGRELRRLRAYDTTDERRRRALAVTTLDAYKALTPAERTAFHEHSRVPQLVEMLRTASRADRDELLEALPLAKRARVHFALWQPPTHVEVTNPGRRGLLTNPVKLTEAVANELDAAGLEVKTRPRYSDADKFTHTLDPFRLHPGESRFYTLEAWNVLLKYDELLAQYVAAGHVTVRVLDADEVRSHALAAWNIETAGARTSASQPPLPPLSNDEDDGAPEPQPDGEDGDALAESTL